MKSVSTFVVLIPVMITVVVVLVISLKSSNQDNINHTFISLNTTHNDILLITTSGCYNVPVELSTMYLSVT